MSGVSHVRVVMVIGYVMCIICKGSHGNGACQVYHNVSIVK